MIEHDICRQPSYGTWGFQLNRGWQLLEKWNLIPDDVDVLMTHGPPVGEYDKYADRRRELKFALNNTGKNKNAKASCSLVKVWQHFTKKMLKSSITSNLKI